MGRIIAAFWNSCAGFRAAYASEQAIRQEVFALFAGTLLSFFVATGWWQQVALIGSLLVVLSVELLNTGLEKLCDHVTPENNSQIKAVKDMGSAAVLCAIAVAVLVWLTALLDRLNVFW